MKIGEPIPDNPDNIPYDTVGELAAFLKGKVTTSVNYARYWHGFLVLYRPLFLIFNIYGIRAMMMLALLILLVYATYLIKEKIGKISAIIFSYTLICMGVFFQIYSLQAGPIILVMMISSVILLKNIEKYDISKFRMHLFLTGMFANYFDFLTTPLLTVGVPIFLYYLYWNKKKNSKKSVKEDLKMIVTSSLMWILGYGLAWGAKWVIYDLIYHEGLIQSAISQVAHRTSGNREELGQVLLEYFSFVIPFSWFAIFAFFTVIVLINSKKQFILKERAFTKAVINVVPLIVIACMPIAWTFVLQNHTAFHSVFTYRIYILFVMAVLQLICELFEVKEMKQKKRL